MKCGDGVYLLLQKEGIEEGGETKIKCSRNEII